MKNIIHYTLFLFGLGMVLLTPLSVASKDIETENRYPILEEALKRRDLIGFADQLFLDEDYYNAMTIYKFALHQGLSSKNEEYLRFRIALCYQMGERYNEAEDAFDEFIAKHPNSDRKAEASFRIGQGFFRNGEYIKAINRFSETQKDFKNTPYESYAKFSTGLAHTRLRNWEMAAQEFARFAKENPQHPFTDRAQTMVELVEEGKTIETKKPWLAGALSIIPGLGKLYTHHYGGAIIALLVNGGLGFVIYDSFDNERYAVGAVFSTLAAATYSANIIGGYRSAIRYNSLQEDKYAQEVVSRGYFPELELEP